RVIGGRRAVTGSATTGPQLQSYTEIGFNPALITESDRVAVPIQFLFPCRKQRGKAGIDLAEDVGQVVVLALGRGPVLYAHATFSVALFQFLGLLEHRRDGRRDPSVGDHVVRGTRDGQAARVHFGGAELRALNHGENSHFITSIV